MIYHWPIRPCCRACLKISRDINTAYDYTNKGNQIAVISNGTAVLGLGDIGAAAAKPVMEGKAVLFKKFADIDGIDLELNTTDADAFVNAVELMTPTFGGINLEDIKAPECFIIEQKLRDKLDIQFFTMISMAPQSLPRGLINALHLTGRDMKSIKVVGNGAGAASIACVELLKTMGVPNDNIIICDRAGPIYKGRKGSMNQWKSAHAVETDARTLEDALVGADVFLGLSSGGVMTKKRSKRWLLGQLFSQWPIQSQKSGQTRSKKCALTPSSQLAGQTFQIRSITSLAFHISSAEPWMFGPAKLPKT